MNSIDERSDEKIVIGQQLISSKVIENREEQVCLGVTPPNLERSDAQNVAMSPEFEASTVLDRHPIDPLRSF